MIGQDDEIGRESNMTAHFHTPANPSPNTAPDHVGTKDRSLTDMGRAGSLWRSSPWIWRAGQFAAAMLVTIAVLSGGLGFVFPANFLPHLMAQGESANRGASENIVRADVYLEYDRLPPGRTCRFAVIFDVKEGWHVNANPPYPENYIPIEVNFRSKTGVRMVPIDYPEGHETTVEFSPEPAMCHSGRFAVRGVLEIPCDLAGPMDELEVVVRYQTCNDKICYAPKTMKLKAAVGIAPAGAIVKPVNPKLFTPREDEES